MLVRIFALLAAGAALVQAGPIAERNNDKCYSGVPGIYTSNVTSFNCPSTTKKSLSQCELQNAMNDFADKFYTQKNVALAFNTYVADNYVQHNPSIADGKAAAVKALSPLFGSNTTKFEIARVMVGPEYTVIHVKAITTGQPNYSVYDAYRTQGSCIVEHWDGLQAATVDNTTVSPHPYF